MSKDPEFYQKNVNSLIALGPIWKPSRLSELNEILIGVVVWSNDLLELAGIYDQQKYLRMVLSNFCNLFTEVCTVTIGYISTTTIKPLDLDRVRAYLGHYPATSSHKNMRHWG